MVLNHRMSADAHMQPREPADGLPDGHRHTCATARARDWSPVCPSQPRTPQSAGPRGLAPGRPSSAKPPPLGRVAGHPAEHPPVGPDVVQFSEPKLSKLAGYEIMVLKWFSKCPNN
ncbi:hypothetical protein KSP39_PZI020629 [Platanthera zijinensis]|uniref:Uncharacterized protein n=1 Tax=Platanthera zijinensis TaxID=2320716 RepID=A0AAP0AZL7_9ASPA